LGTEGFAWFDFGTPSIIALSTSFDCHLTLVANSMAFVKCLEKVEFRRSNMEAPEQSLQPNKIRFLLKKQPLSLMPFWNRVMRDGGQLRHLSIQNLKILFKCMQTEYIEVVDEIASVTIRDETLFNRVQTAIQSMNVGPASMPSSQMEPINLLSPNMDER
jgi:hypothetical protein